MPTPAEIERALGDLILDPPYPCLGAKSAWKRGSYQVGVYERMDHALDLLHLADDLDRFTAAQQPGSGDLTTYVAVFTRQFCVGGQRLADALWPLLRWLNRADRRPWATGYSHDPADPTFAFSYGGQALFVAGLCPGHSRRGRRWAWPALAINPHHQFVTLRQRGHFEKMATVIRQRDAVYQGEAADAPHPFVAHHGERSEALQYAGALPRDPALLRPFTR